jgi:hypothetical protein
MNGAETPYDFMLRIGNFFPLWATNTECVESGVKFVIKVSIECYIEQPKGK